MTQRPTDELGYFQLFFTDQILQEITDATNLYFQVKIVRPLQQFSIWHIWTDVSLAEMKSFLGVVLNMGLHHKPEIVDYFMLKTTTDGLILLEQQDCFAPYGHASKVRARIWIPFIY